MSTDIRKIWAELDVNLELHDELLQVLARSHERTHLGQKNRPKAMAFFDHALHASHDERVAEIHAYRKNGGKSIGTFCIYVPDEIAIAAGVIPIPLCGGTGWSVSYADKMFPRDICPIVRSTFGLSFSGTCPYKKLKDFAVGETTCDAKKKAWDLVGFKVMEVPQKKNPVDRDLWAREVAAFKDMMEKLSGMEVTAEALGASTRLLNRRRKALQRINFFRKLDHPPISGLDALLVSQVALSQEPAAFSAAAEELADELEERVRKGLSAYDGNGTRPRVMMAGTPAPLGYAKVHFAVESSGLSVVADESCTGSRYYSALVDESPTTLDGMMAAIADRYFSIDCSCFSPNAERLENVIRTAKEYRVQGVVQNILQYCHGYNIESKAVEKALAKENIPSLKIVTDYADEDLEQLRVRIETFAEMLRG
jgi:benzoyl-CoA reductase/2-hydroxyglutaryl-CoA dehydratase subunit BcrC/BadD/HgdB